MSRASRRLRLALQALAGLVALAACTSPLESDERWRRAPGVIEIGGPQPPPIELPDTARPGVGFTAVVTTWGSGTCTRADGAIMLVSGRTAVVRPYDRWNDAGVCTGDLAPYPRDVTLRFDDAGEALVRVIGRTVLGEPAQYETRLLVQP